MVASRVSGQELELAGGLGSYVKELVERLQIGTMEGKEKAASTLESLAKQQTDYADMIGRSDAVPPLVTLVLVGSPVAQEYAAAALACVAWDA